MPYLYLKLILFFISLIFAALFAFLETAFTAIRLFKVKELSQSVKKYEKLFYFWENNPQKILVTILIANNLVHVSSSVLITDVMQIIFGDTGIALAIGVSVATCMILVFGEIIPKSYAKAQHDQLFQSFLWLLYFLLVIFSPIVSALMWIASKFVKNLDEVKFEKGDLISEKEIEFLIGYSDKEGIMEAEKTEMLQNIFSLGQTQVKEIMVPSNDMVAIDVNSSFKYASEIFSKYRYTRLPVYEDKEDNIIGLIHQKDIFELVYSNQEKPLRSLVMPILFVPESKKINQLLREFLEKRIHMAVLIDEYGAVTGLVTLEDVLEEIVGPISDEHEHIHSEIVTLEHGGWMIDAKVPLDELEELLNIKFETEGSVTLAGFLAEKLQHLPKKGERIYYGDYCFQIQKADPRRVYQVLVFKEKSNNQ